MTTKILGNQITNFTIETTQLSNTAVSAFAVALAPKVLYANVANSTFSVLDDTAVNTGGGYIVVTGSDFVSGATVLIDTTQASAVTFVNSTTLQVQVPAKAAASYNLYVVNPDGGVGIKVSGISYSAEPTWVTATPLGNQNSNTAFSVNFSATGATSYSVAAGSSLPPGTSLLANGYFSGTVSIGSQTTYSFVIRATDAELQDADKTFGVTVTVNPPAGLYLWGSNSTNYSGLGLNDTVNRSSPTQVGTDATWNLVAMGYRQAAAIKTNGTLWSFGYNSDGQLGQNDAVSRSSPTQVGAGTTWSFVSTGSPSMLALQTNGTLWSWGFNSDGRLGLNDRVKRSNPVQVGSSTDWSQIVHNNLTSMGIKTNGTLWLWGSNRYGQLGNNDNSYSYRSSPTQLGTGTDWSKLPTNVGITSIGAAIKTNGTLWTWGRNIYGALGQSTNYSIPISSPVQVGAATDWSQMSIGFYNFMAIKTNGTLWGWGGNGGGALGLNDRVYRSSPVQVGALTNWSKVSIFSNHCAAIKNDGTLWTWGSGNAGKTGQNDRVYRSSPVQVGAAANWSKVIAGGNVTMATMS